ncbi:MAG: hypothetical protein H0Z24_10030 [Thermosipho sp. (in: Bacteria)]|nr:hypothetical protein [Thermosipho sp. (in: thermotogales)]
MSEQILPAVPIDDPGQKDRLLMLEKLSPPQLDIHTIKSAIRIECHGRWIDKAIAVWEAGAYDSAYLYFWNRAMADLRTKIMAYGKEHLEAIIKREIRDERDLVHLLDDKDLIDHCFELGIISEEAWFFLNKAREVRNHYSLAHHFDAPIDPIEAFNIIKNCIKYVLAHQVPAPGINLKDFLEKLKSEDISEHLAEFEAIYQEQAVKIVNITLNRLFDDFVAERSNHTYMNNILLLAPILWSRAESSVKERIGKRVAKLRVEADADTNAKALAFIKRVNGMRYVPASVRVAIFASAAEKLYDACQEANNFYNETGPAKELYELGRDVPSSAIRECTRAVFLSFIGNQYGYSWGASCYNRKMIETWNSANLSALVDILDNDLVVIGRLDSKGPASRFKEVFEIVSKIPRDEETNRRLSIYKKLDVERLTKLFFDKYMSKFSKV